MKIKRFAIVLICILALLTSSVAYADTHLQQETTELEESKIDVIAYFNKCDSVSYWIQEGRWEINGTDTVLTASAIMKVRINVVDSTDNGYKMEYAFIDIPPQDLPDSATQKQVLMNRLSDTVSKRIIGTTICFETDETGKITGFNNLGRIKKQAEALQKDILKELSGVPEIRDAEKMGIDVKAFVKSNLDNGALIESYLEELKTMFMYHGYSFKPGEYEWQEEATDTSNETSYHLDIYSDYTDDSYQIIVKTTEILPEEQIRRTAGDTLASLVKKKNRDALKEFLDDSIVANGINADYIKFDYLSNGWPDTVLRQRKVTIGDRQQIKQTLIQLSSYHFAW